MISSECAPPKKTRRTGGGRVRKVIHAMLSESLEGVILGGLGLAKIGDADEGAWHKEKYHFATFEGLC